MGLDILRQQDAPKYIQAYAQQLLKENSPIKLSKSERDEKLDFLLNHIPIVPAKVEGEEIKTWGDLSALAMMYVKWSRDVQDLCPECVSEEVFKERYKESKREFRSLVDKDK